MEKDFLEIASYAADKEIYVTLATNGTLITEEMACRLKEARIQYVEVSLDGANPLTHDSFRNTSNAFELTVRGVRNLIKQGIFTCIATTATRYTLPEVAKIVELCKMFGVMRFLVFNSVPTGRGKDIVDIDLSPTERENLLNFLYDELIRGDLEVLCTAPQYARVCLQRSLLTGSDMVAQTHFYAGELRGRTKSLAGFIGGCGAGRLYCAIQPNGLVTPCVFMPIIVGNLRRERFKSIWFSSKVMRDLRDRDRLKGKCGQCSFRYVCGGCRARAYAYHGDYLASDPGCIRS